MYIARFVSMLRNCAITALCLFAASASATQEASTCFGTPEQGRLINGMKLPTDGNNFSAYSSIGALAGRTYVHSEVYAVVVGAYKQLETTAPLKHYIYGETGLAEGGKFRPHKSHQNGLSVDFFVPVKDQSGKPATLPIGISNKFGYNIEFDKRGHFDNMTIDFEAISDHLLALRKSADEHNLKIRRVIFDNDLQKLLFQAADGEKLQHSLTFSTKKPWVRHDEHYHVDFLVPCKPL